MTSPDAPAERRRIAYQPGLDGLRGLAVLAVLLYHDSLNLNGRGRGGFIGVDVFFVLSGFLITSLLLAEFGSRGSIDFKQFWARRARRLAPALLLLFVLVLLLGPLVYPPLVRDANRTDLFYSLFYVENWHLAVWHGSFQSVLWHTWSLSVEEQWYLFWPPVLALLLAVRRFRRALLIVVPCALALASAAWMAYLYAHGNAAHANFGTDARAQELLVGAVLGIVASRTGLQVRGPIRWPLEAAAATALAVFGYLVWRVGLNPHWFRGGYLALAVGTALVITAAVQTRGPVRALLATKPLTAIGQISYGIYLFHVPLYRWLDPSATGLDGLTLLALRVVATFVLATASFVLLERPIRRGKLPDRALARLGVVVVGVIAIGDLVAPRPALPSRSATTAIATALRTAAASAPPDTTRVLVIGGTDTAVLQLSTRGPHEGAGIEGYALGTYRCGLTSTATGCGAIPDQLGRFADAFGADVVVMMIGPSDLVGYSGRAPGEHDDHQVGRRLDELRRFAGRRPVVLMPIWCTDDRSSGRLQLDSYLRRWARASGTEMTDPVECARATTGAAAWSQAIWQRIATLAPPAARR